MTKLVSSVILTLLLLTDFASAEEFVFCPQGFFATESGDVTFAPQARWSSDYTLEIKDICKMNFAGPILPGYKLPQPGTVEVNTNENKVIATQHCKEFDADIEKTFTLVNGAILSTVSYTTETPVGKNATFRIFLPMTSFAGKTGFCDDKELPLPKEKDKNYILSQGNQTTELRFPYAEGKELGIKLLSGIKLYRIADCRHHGKSENYFHISIEFDGTSISYLLCLLEKGQPFPDVEQEQQEEGRTNPKENLLGQGAGFEVGPKNFIPFAYYNWASASGSPATSIPAFDTKEKIEGKYSLRLQADDITKLNGRFNMNAAIFRKVKLDTNKTYTLSAWMKSDIDGLQANLVCREGVWDGSGGVTVKTSKEWKRYSYTFKPDKYKLLNYCTSWAGIHPSVKAGKLWIDAVQLEEGGLSPYMQTPIEFGAEIKKEFKLFTLDELKDASIDLHFRNNTEKLTPFTINYVIKNYWNQVVAQGTSETDLPASTTAANAIRIPLLATGYYRVSLNGEDSACRDEVIFGVYEPLKTTGKLPTNWPLGGDASEGTPIVRKLGFGWTRCWDFTLKQVCPEEGEFNFAETDIIVKRCMDANLNLMPILGTGFGRPSYVKEGELIPKWAVDRDAQSSVKGSWAKNVYFPKIDAWKTYVKALVSRYKDSIKAWEALNEPNCWITADEYVPYLQATYEAAKEADPGCLIVGGCATSDWGGEPAPWTKRVLELDGCRSMDVLSIHMYSNIEPENYKENGSDSFLHMLKQYMKNCGRVIPIWHSEKSHNTTTTGYSQFKHGVPAVYMNEPGFRVKDFRHKAEYILREALIDSSVGNGPYFWFGNLPNNIYINSHRMPYGLQHTEYDNSPCPELLAANGLARMVEGRCNPEGLIKLGANVYCAIYSGERGTVAAIWNRKENSSMNIDGGGISIYDFFGAKIPDATGMNLNIGTAPVYLDFGNTSVDAVTERIKAATTEGKQFEFSGGIESDGTQTYLAVYARNLCSSARELSMTVLTADTGLSFAQKTITISCKPDKFTRFAFPLTISASDKTRLIHLKTPKETFYIPVLAVKTAENLAKNLNITENALALRVSEHSIHIDGKLDDWSDTDVCYAESALQVKTGRSSWKNPTDLSGELRFRWDNEFLYLAALINDDVLERNATIERVYMSDGMELFLGLNPENRKTDTNTVSKTSKNDFQFFLAPGVAKGKFSKAEARNQTAGTSNGIQIESTITENGYAIEAAIAWKSLSASYMPAAGNKIGMTFQISDSDKKDGPTERKIFWTGNDGNWLNPSQWGTLIIQ